MSGEGLPLATEYYVHPEIACSRNYESFMDGEAVYVSEIPYPETPEHGVIVVVTPRFDDEWLFSLSYGAVNDDGYMDQPTDEVHLTWVSDVDNFIDKMYARPDMEKITDSVLFINGLQVMPF